MRQGYNVEPPEKAKHARAKPPMHGKTTKEQNQQNYRKNKKKNYHKTPSKHKQDHVVLYHKQEINRVFVRFLVPAARDVGPDVREPVWLG